jgi:hypothetical protein
LDGFSTFRASFKILLMAAIKNNDLGFVYNFPLRIAGFILMAMGLVVMLMGWLGVVAGIVLLVGGGYFALTATGISIDFNEKAVRHYTSFGGLKTGKWIQYTTYPFVCIIRKQRKRSKLLAESTVEAEKPYQYEVHLLSRSHRGRVLMDLLYDREEAERIARYYAQEMELEVVEYQSPGRAKKRGAEEGGDNKSHHHRHRTEE